MLIFANLSIVVSIIPSLNDLFSNFFFVFLIVRQHAYACTARYMANLSVCLSVTLWYCMQTNAHTVKLLPPSGIA